MKKKIKCAASVCFAAVLLLLQTVTGFAADISVFDPEREGSVTVSFRTAEGETMTGTEITLYKIADLSLKADEERILFSYTDGFKSCGIEIPEALDSADAKKLSDYAAETHPDGKTEKTDKDGAVCFDQLSPGIYLAVQTGEAEGFSVSAPFLSCIPATEGDEWIYDVNASPKTDIKRLTDITVKKVWNDDGKDRPGEITVQLLHSGRVYDTVTLSEKDKWEHTWRDLEKDGEWSVQEINIPKGYTATYKQSGMTFTVENTPTLIQTGQLQWPVPVFAAAGLVCIAIGWLLIYSRKKKDNA